MRPEGLLGRAAANSGGVLRSFRNTCTTHPSPNLLFPSGANPFPPRYQEQTATTSWRPDRIPRSAVWDVNLSNDDTGLALKGERWDADAAWIVGGGYCSLDEVGRTTLPRAISAYLAGWLGAVALEPVTGLV